jgi:ADP-heptose:LPS heptosyltransferase
MNVSSMRRIDRWIGLPACAVLTLVRRLDDLVFRRKPLDQPKKIAVIKLAEQGATVLAGPALARAREAVGDDNLYFVVFAQNRFIVDLMKIVRPDRVLAIRATGPLRTVLDTLRVVWRMRREQIDATLDLEFFARSSALLSYLSGARTRVGFHAYYGEASYRGDLMTHRLSFNPFLHASEIFQLLVSALYLPADKLPACDVTLPEGASLDEYRPEPTTVAEVEAILRDALRCDVIPPIVLLNANCSDLLPLRRWPRDRYSELTNRLLDRHPDLAVAFTGAPDEAPEAQDLVRRIGSDRCVSLAGRTTLDQLFALYGLSELMITNDSGPAHYATLTSVDVITLFGPETPAVFGARTPRSHLLWAGLPCSPCVNAFNDRQSACRDNVCMQRISVDEVFALACRVLQDRGDARADRPAARIEATPRPASASGSTGR